MKKILFICTGNTCRSPMAAALFNKMMGDCGKPEIQAESAGLAAFEGEPTSANAQAALREIGIDLSAHRARRITPGLLQGCDAVYALSPSHLDALLRAFPARKEEIHLLGDGIPDPFGGDLTVYRRCRDAIAKALEPLKKEYGV